MSDADEAGALRILITNRILSERTGTELYVRDLAIGLAARGHRPVVYSPILGDVSREIRVATVPVTDDLATVAEPPDVIHGHHGLEMLAAMLAFPAAPAVSVCHSWIGWADVPLHFPRILRYVAVDQTCRDRLCLEHGIDPFRVEVALNSVDLDRFRPRGPLPAKPTRALVFSNSAGGPWGSQLEPIQQACAAEGIEVEVMGFAARRPHERPEEVLPGFDLVFAKAKAALEALAVGNAVILCDAAGSGPMVTTANLHQLRPMNFGIRTLRNPVTAKGLRQEIARYDPTDAAAVSQEVRSIAGRDLMIDQLCAIYSEVVAEHRIRANPDPGAEMAAAAEYLQWLAPRMYQRDLLRALLQRMLRTPGMGWALRSVAARAGEQHWLSQLLRMEARG